MVSGEKERKRREGRGEKEGEDKGMKKRDGKGSRGREVGGTTLGRRWEDAGEELGYINKKGEGLSPSSIGEEEG